MHGAHLAGPGIKHDQVAFGLAFKHLSIVVDDRRLPAEERPGGRSGLARDRAGQRRDHDAAGLALTPGVDARQPAVALHVYVPAPGLRLARFPDPAPRPPTIVRGFL